MISEFVRGLKVTFGIGIRTIFKDGLVTDSLNGNGHK